jgi:hypothetical protein
MSVQTVDTCSRTRVDCPRLIEANDDRLEVPGDEANLVIAQRISIYTTGGAQREGKAEQIVAGSQDTRERVSPCSKSTVVMLTQEAS